MQKMNSIPWKTLFPYAVVLLSGAALLILKAQTLEPVRLLLCELLILFGGCAAIGDLRTKRIPNRLLGAMLAAWLLVLVPQLFLQTEQALLLLLDGAIGFLLGGGLFLIVYLVSRKGLGGGDVKLMAVSGLYLGFTGTLPAMLYGAVLAAVTGIVLILIKKVGRRDTIPMAPFLYVGMVLTMLIQ